MTAAAKRKPPLTDAQLEAVRVATYRIVGSRFPWVRLTSFAVSRSKWDGEAVIGVEWLYAVRGKEYVASHALQAKQVKGALGSYPAEFVAKEFARGLFAHEDIRRLARDYGIDGWESWDKP